MIILIAQIVLAIVVFVYIGDLQEATRIVIDRLWTNRQQEGGQQLWDNIQSTVSFVCFLKKLRDDRIRYTLN